MQRNFFFTVFFVLLSFEVMRNSYGQWVQASCPNYSTPFSLIVNGSDVFAGFSSSGIYVSSDNGVSWKSSNNGLELDIANNYSINCFGLTGFNLFVATDMGVFESTDNGNNWHDKSAGLPIFPVTL